MKENSKYKLIKNKRKLVPIAFGSIVPIVSAVSGTSNTNTGIPKKQKEKDLEYNDKYVVAKSNDVSDEFNTSFPSYEEFKNTSFPNYEEFKKWITKVTSISKENNKLLQNFFDQWKKSRIPIYEFFLKKIKEKEAYTGFLINNEEDMYLFLTKLREIYKPDVPPNNIWFKFDPSTETWGFGIFPKKQYKWGMTPKQQEQEKKQDKIIKRDSRDQFKKLKGKYFSFDNIYDGNKRHLSLSSDGFFNIIRKDLPEDDYDRKYIIIREKKGKDIKRNKEFDKIKEYFLFLKKSKDLEDVQEIKTIIQQITAQKKAIQTIDAVSTATTLNEDAWKKLVDGQPFFDTKGTTLTYTHNGITHDGDLEVTVNITKAGTDKQEEAKFKVAVSGIDWATETSRLEALDKVTIRKTKDVAQNSLSKEELQLGQAHAGSFTYKITHDKITEDGEYEVNVALSKGGKTKTIKRKIKIEGINAANKQHALQAIKSLNENSLASVYTTADKVKLPSISSNIDDTKKAKIVELIKSLMTRENAKALIAKEMISFEANNDNGDLVIKIQLKSLNGGKEETKNTTITNFKTFGHVAKKLALKKINELNLGNFSNISFNKNSLASHAHNTSSSIKNSIVQLIKNQIDSDSASENTVKNIAKSLIKANLISFETDDINQKLTIKINRSAPSLGGTDSKDIAIIGFENIEKYNKKPKIVATNNDNVEDGQVIYSEDAAKVIVVKKMATKEQLDLLKNINIDSADKVFKVTFENSLEGKNGAYELNDLKNKNGFANLNTVFITLYSEEAKNNGVAYEKNIKNSSDRNIKMQLKWIKNSDNTWNLQLYYDSKENGDGEDDSIYRYNVEQSTESYANKYDALQTIKSLNETSLASIYTTDDKVKLPSASSNIDDTKKAKIVELIKSLMTRENAKALIAKEMISFDASGASGKLTIKINKGDPSLSGTGSKDIIINGFEDIEMYNKKIKIVATNDDNNQDNEVINSEDATQVIVVKKFNTKEQVDLLKNINIDSTTHKVFKVTWDSIKDNNSSPYTLEQIKGKTEFSNLDTIFIKLNPEVKNDSIAYAKVIKNGRNRNIEMQLKWIKNSDNTWNLQLYYASKVNATWEDDSIYRYKVQESTKEEQKAYLKTYNSKPKIVATNEDATQNNQVIYSEDGDQVIVQQKFDTKEQVDLLKNINIDSADKVFKVTFENFLEGKNGAYVLSELKTKNGFANPDTVFITLYSEEAKNNGVAYEKNIKNTSNRNIKMQLKWIKNSDNTWNLQLYYDSKDGGSGEDDSIYRYKVEKSTKDAANKYDALQAIKSLNETSFTSIYTAADKIKLPSTSSNIDDTKKAKIVELIKSLMTRENAKALIKKDMISLETNNNDGNLVIKIQLKSLNGENEKTKTTTITNFKTLANAAKELALKTINALNPENFSSIAFNKNALTSNAQNISSSIKNSIVNLIKSQIEGDSISEVVAKEAAKALIKVNLISFDANDANGKLTIKINKSAPSLSGTGSKDITISGFEDIETYNRKPKIVARNDDNTKDNQEIYFEDGKGIIVVKKFNTNVQVDLIKNAKTQIPRIFYLFTSYLKSPEPISKSPEPISKIAYELEYLQNRISDVGKFKPLEFVGPDKDLKILYQLSFLNEEKTAISEFIEDKIPHLSFNQNQFFASAKWVENSDHTKTLKLNYLSTKNSPGEDDSIYKYQVITKHDLDIILKIIDNMKEQDFSSIFLDKDKKTKLPGDNYFHKKDEILQLIKSKIKGIDSVYAKDILLNDLIDLAPDNDNGKLVITIKTKLLGKKNDKKITINNFKTNLLNEAKKILSKVINNLQANNLERSKEISTSLNIEVTKSMILNYIQDKIRNYKFADDFKANNKTIRGVQFLKSIKVEAQGMISDQWISINRKENSLEVTIKEPQINNGINKSITLSSLMDKETYNEKPKIVATNDDQSNSTADKIKVFSDKNILVTIIDSGQDKKIDLLKHITNNKKSIFKIDIDAVKAPHNNKRGAFTLEDLQSRIQEQNFEPYSSTYAIWTENTKNDDVAKEFNLKSSSNRKISAQLKWALNTDKTWNLQLVYNSQEDRGGEDDSIYRYKVKSINKTLNYNEKSKVVATNDDNTAENDFKDIYNESDFRNVIISKKSEKGKQVDLLQELSFGQNEPSYFEVNIKKVINSESTSGAPFTLEDIKNRIFPAGNIEQVKTAYIKWDPSYESQGSVAIYNNTITNAAGRNIKLELKWEKNANNKWALKLNYVSFDQNGNGEDDAIYIYDVKPIKVANDDQKQQADIQEIKTIIQQITAQKKATQTIDAVSTATTLNEEAWKNLVDGQSFFDTKGTTLTYTHNGITQDGDLEVTVNITKAGTDKQEEAKFKVAVSGIDFATEKNRIEQLNRLTITKTNDIAKDALTKDKLGLGQANVEGFTYQITHNKITKDGDYEVNVALSKGGKTEIIKRKIKIQGINAAKANADIDFVKTEIKKIKNMTKTTDNSITAVNSPLTFDANALTSLGDGGTFPTEIKGTTLTYTHSGITQDGDLEVTVNIEKSPGESKKAKFKVAVSGINLNRAKSNAKKIINDIQTPPKNPFFKEQELFNKINQVRNTALEKITKSTKIQEVDSFAASSTKGTQVVSLLKAIKNYNDAIYNHKSKVVATNDDDKKQKGFKKDIYDESNPEYVIVAKTWNTQEQIDLLINLKMDPERKNNIFKIDIDRIKSKYEFKSSAFTLEGLKEVTEEANFKKYGTIYAIWKNDTENGKIANSFNLENHNHKNIIAKLKWIKNENGTWNLKLSYDPDDYHGGEDDSIYRYKAQKISETIPSYNEKSKVVATNEDNTVENDFHDIYDESDFKNVIISKKSEKGKQVDLLQDLSFGKNEPSYFEVNIKKVINSESTLGAPFTLEDIKNRIFPAGNIEQVKTAYIKWDPSYESQGSVAIYNNTITNAAGRNIKLELKWEKNANNKWALKLNYVSFDQNGNGEDDAIYIYDVKPIKVANDDQKQQADIQEIKTIIQQITAQKKSTQTIDAVSTATTLNEEAWKNLVDGQSFFDTKGTTLTYTHNGITHDGDLKVTVNITKAGTDKQEEAKFKVAVSGIDFATEKNRIEQLNRLTITKTNDIAKDALTKDKLGLGQANVEGFTYQITHNKITKDGDYEVNVALSKGGKTEIIKRKIKIQGINAAKANADIDFVKTEIKKIKNMTKTTDNSITAVNSPLTFDANALTSLGDGGTFPTEIKGTTLTYTHKGITQDGDLEVTVNIEKSPGESKKAKFKVAVSGINLNRAKSNAKKIISNIKTPQKNIYFKEEELFNKIEAVRKTALEKITKSTTTEEVESFAASSKEGTEVSNLLEAIKNYDDAIYNHKCKVVATNDDNEHENQRISYKNKKEIVVLKEFGAKEQVDLLRNISSSNNSKLFYIAIDSVDSKNNFKSGAFDSQDLKSRNSENNFEKLQVIKVELKPDTKNGDIAQTLTLKNSSLRDIVVNLKWIKNNNKWSLKLFYNSQANIQGGEDDSIYRYRYISNLDKNKILETINSAAIDKEVLKLYNNTKKLEKLPGDVVFRKKSEILSLIKNKILGLKNPLVKEIITGDFISFSPNNQEKKLDIIIKTEILGSETNKKISISGFVKESSYYAKKILSEVIKNLQANNLERNKEISTSLNIEVTKSMILNYIQDKIRNYKFADDFKANNEIVQGVMFLKSIKVEAQGMISDQWISINKKENNLEVTIKEPQIENGINKSITLSSLMDKETYNEKPKIVATNDDQSNSTADKIKVFSDKNILVTIIDSSQDHKIDLLKHVTNNKKSIFKIDIDAVKAPHNNKRGAFTLEDLQSRIQEQNFKFYSSTYAIWTENTKNDDVAKEFNLKSSSNRKISAQLKWALNTDKTWNLQLVYNSQEDHGGEDDSIYRYKVKSINKTLNYNEKSKVVATNDDNTVKRDFKDIYDKSDFKNVIVSKIKGEEEQVELLQDLSFGQNEPSYFEVNIKKVINSENNSGDPFTLEDIKNRIFPVENIEQVKTTYIKWDPSYKDQRSVDIYNDTITNTAGENIKLKFKWEKNANNKWALKLFYYSQADEWGEEDDSIYIYDVKPIKVANDDQKQQADIQEIKTIIQQITAQKKATQTIDAVSTATTLNEEAWNKLVDSPSFFGTKGATLTYTHNGITHDGDLEVTVNITKAGTDKQEEAKFKVAVSGINLNKAKATAKGFINELAYPTQDNANHDAKLFEAIEAAKKAALSAINKATSPANITTLASSKTEGSEVKKVLAKIKAYNGSTGTIVANANAAIDKAIGDATKPTIKDGSAIKTAKDVAVADLIAPTSTGTLTFTVSNVVPFTKNSDGTTVTATVKVTSSVQGTKTGTYTAEVSGFTSKVIVDSNAEIDKAVAAKAAPIIKGGSATKTAEKVSKDDLIAPSQNGLTFAITKVEKSTTNADGTTVTATVKVTSSVQGTKTTGNTYAAEVSGFTSETDKAKNDANADINFVKTEIEKIKGMTKNVDNSIAPVDSPKVFDADAFTSLGTGQTFPTEIKGTTLTYTHKGITQDGDLEVTVNIEKSPGESKKAKFKVAVSGINLNKAKNKAKKIISNIKTPQKNIYFKEEELFNKIEAVRKTALEKITKSTTIEEVESFAASSKEGTQVSNLLEAIKNYDDAIYNHKCKVVATNDDDKKQKGFKKDIYDESNPEYVIVAKTWNTQEQIDLLINLKMDQERKNNIFKIDIDRIKSKYEFKSSAFTLKGLEEITEEANFKKYGTIYAIWKNDTENGTIANSFNLENHNHKNIIAKLKWIKNENGTWNLKLSYDPDDYHGGEDDSIYRYKAQKISETIPSYNEKSKVVATNEDNTVENDFHDIYDESDFKNVIISKKSEKGKQVDLLQDLSFGKNEPSYFEVNIKKVINSESTLGAPFTLEDIKNRIFPAGNIEPVKTTYIKWDPSYKNQGSVAIYNDAIINAAGRNIKLELKWEKNANNKWALKLNYVSFDPNGNGEDDAIYIYDVKPIKVANDDQKQQADIQEIKTIIQQITAQKKATQTINAVSTATTLNEDAWKNLIDGQSFFDTKGTTLTYTHNGIIQDGDLEVTVNITKAGTDKQEEAKFKVAVSGINLNRAKSNAKKIISNIKTPQKNIYFKEEELFNKIEAVRKTALEKITKSTTTEEVESFAASSKEGTEVSNLLEAIKNYDDAIYNHKCKVVATNDDNEHENQRISYKNKKEIVVLKEFGAKEQVDLLRNISSSNNSKLFYIAIDSVDSKNNFKSGAFDSQDLKSRNSENNFEKLQVIKVELKPDTKNGDIAQTLTLKNSSLRDIVVNLKWIKNNNKWSLKLFYNSQANIQGGEDDSIYRYRYISNLDKNKILETINSAAIDKEVLKLYNNTKKLEKLPGDVVFRKKSEILSLIKNKILGLKNPLVKEIITGDFISFSPNNQEKKLDIIIKTEILGSETNKKISISGFVKESSYYAKKILSEVIKNLQANNLERNKEISTSLNIEVTKSMILNYIQDKIRNYKFADDFKANNEIVQGVMFLKSIKVEAQGMISDQWISINRKENSLEVTIKEPQIENGINKSITLSSLMDKETYNEKPKIVATNDDQSNSTADKIKVFSDKNILVTIIDSSQDHKIDLLKHITNNKKSIFKIDIDAVKAPHNNKRGAFTLEDLQSRIQEQNFEPYSSTYAIWTENTKNDDVAKEFNLKSSSNRKISAQLKWALNTDKTWNLQLVYNSQEDRGGEDDSIYRYKVESIDKTLNYNEKSKVVATNDDNTVKKDFKDIYNESDFRNVIISKKSEKGKQVDLLQDLSFDQNEPSYFEVNIKKVINSESTSGDPFTLEGIKNRIFPAGNIEPVKTTYIKWDPSYKNQGSVAIYNNTITNAVGRNIKLELKWEKNANNKWALKLNYVSFDPNGNGEDDAIYIYDVKPIKVANDDQKQQADIQEIKTIIQQITAQKKATQTIDAVSTATTLNEEAWKNLVDGQSFFDTKGTTLTYTHNGIAQDGDLEVTVNITKAGTDKQEEAKFKVAVSGIDFATEKNRIEQLNRLTITKTNDIAKDALTKDKLGLGQANVEGFTYQITHNKITKDGDYEVNVALSKGGKTEIIKRKIKIQGINAAKANADIDFVKTEIKKIKNMTKTTDNSITAVNSPLTFDANALTSLGDGGTFPTEIKGTTLTYTHSGITQDGDLEVTVNIEKSPGESKKAKFKVAVSGIDFATEKNRIEQLNRLTITKTNDIAKDALTKDKLGLGQANVEGFTYQITHNKITKDGDYEVNVALSKGGKTEIIKRKIKIQGINAAKANADIDFVKTEIKKIKNMTKTTDNSITAVNSPLTFDANALTSLGDGGTFPTEIKGTTLTYTHKGITQDGDLEVTVNITKAGTDKQEEAKFKVAVSGIDFATEKNRIEQLNRLTITKTNDIAKDALTKDKLGLGQANVEGFTYQITHNKITKDGDYEVNVALSKGGKTEIIKRKIKIQGINAAKANADIDFVKTEIKKIKNMIKTTDNSITAVNSPLTFDANALTSLGDGGTFPTEIKGTTLTYTHKGITQDGDLEVTVNIEKSPGESKKAKFKVAVSGINLNKAKATAKGFINELAYPTQDNENHDAKLFEAIEAAKKAALSAINKATSPDDITTLASSKTEGSEVQKVLVAIKAYNGSTGTIVANANAEIDKAIGDATKPTIKDGSAIKTAKDVAVADLIAPTSTGTLTFTVSNVVPSTKNSDGTTVTATVTVTSSVEGAKTTDNTYTVEVGGFTSETDKAKNDANAEIDAAVKKHTAPTIKDNDTKKKTAEKVSKDDLIPPSQDGLTFTITKVQKSTQKTDGTAVTATVTVTSSVQGAKTTGNTYIAEVSGFTSETDKAKNDANADINFVKTEIEKIKGMTKNVDNSIATVDSPKVFDADAFTSLGTGQTFLSDTKGTTLTYTHKGIDQDGDLEITVTIAKSPGQSKQTKFKVAVSGINSAAKEKAEAFIEHLRYPKQDDSIHNPNLFKAIDKAKIAAINAIEKTKKPQDATNMASSPTTGTELAKVQKAIESYNKSKPSIVKKRISSKNKKNSLISKGAIIGIVLGTIFLAIVSSVSIYMYKKKKKSKKSN